MTPTPSCEGDDTTDHGVAHAEAEPTFDPALVEEMAYYLELAENEWRLHEEALWHATESLRDPDAPIVDVYAEALDAVARLFPADHPLPALGSFRRGDLSALVYEGLRNISSRDGDRVRAVIASNAEATTTIEAALDSSCRGILPQTPVHVFRTDVDGTRRELTLFVPETDSEYDGLAWLLDAGAEALAEAEAPVAR